MINYYQYYKKGGTYVIPIEIFNDLLVELEELHNKIDNAIKYINNNSIYFATSEKVGNYFSNCNCDDLLEILKSDVD